MANRISTLCPDMWKLMEIGRLCDNLSKIIRKVRYRLDLHRCQDAGETGDLVERAGPVIRRRLVSLWVKYKRATG